MFRAIALTLRARLRRNGGLRSLFLNAAATPPVSGGEFCPTLWLYSCYKLMNISLKVAIKKPACQVELLVAYAQIQVCYFVHGTEFVSGRCVR